MPGPGCSSGCSVAFSAHRRTPRIVRGKTSRAVVRAHRAVAAAARVARVPLTAGDAASVEAEAVRDATAPVNRPSVDPAASLQTSLVASPAAVRAAAAMRTADRRYAAPKPTLVASAAAVARRTKAARSTRRPHRHRHLQLPPAATTRSPGMHGPRIAPPHRPRHRKKARAAASADVADVAAVVVVAAVMPGTVSRQTHRPRRAARCPPRRMPSRTPLAMHRIAAPRTLRMRLPRPVRTRRASKLPGTPARMT